MSRTCRFINHVCAFLQIALAIAIIVIVALELYDVSVIWNGVDYQMSCILGTNYGSTSLCEYTWAVCGISLAVSLLISLVQCVTCKLCGLGVILDILFAAAGTVWWIIAAAIITTNVNNAKGSMPPNNWRTAVVGLAWTEVGIFGLLTVSGLLRSLF